MAGLKVLVEGYAKEVEGGWIASSTVTFVMSNGKNIIIDPGCNRERLLAALDGEGLATGDINFVILTHTHTDHALLAGIFENAEVLTPYELYKGDHQTEHDNKVPGTELEIIETPGHAAEHCSVKVPTKDGVYVVGGDVFWWVDGQEQKLDIGQEDDAHPDEVSMDDLKASRQKIFDIADFIVPGHGKTVKVR